MTNHMISSPRLPGYNYLYYIKQDLFLQKAGNRNLTNIFAS